MKVDVQTQVVSEPLHDDEHTRVQRATRPQTVLELALASKRLHHPRGEAPTHEREQLGIVAEPHGHRTLEGQDPLAPRDGRESMIDEQCRRLAHAPAHARWTDPAALAREGYPQRVTAPAALGDEETLLEISAGCESLELVAHERRQGPGVHLDALAKRRPVLANDRHRVALLRASGDVARARVTGGHRGGRCRSRAGPRR
jgi:hypothetical protein